MQESCNRGHEFTPENTYWKGPQKRECRTCRRLERKKAAAKTRYEVIGITVEEAAELKAKGCEVCGTTDNVGVDHCHRTGKIRGALCSRCNLALGNVSDDIGILHKLIAYLMNHET